MSIEITPELLAKLRQKAESATPGPWEQCNGSDVFTLLGATSRSGLKANDSDGWHVSCCAGGVVSVGNGYASLETREKNANAAFIAAVNPSVVLALVDEIERSRKALMAIHELERKRWESAVKAFGTIPGELQRGSRND